MLPQILPYELYKISICLLKASNTVNIENVFFERNFLFRMEHNWQTRSNTFIDFIYSKCVSLKSNFSEFTEGAIVGITLGGVLVFALLCAIIAFSAVLYYKRMCPCINQQMFAPKPVEIHFNSYGKGPAGARGAEAVSPWVTITISNDKDEEVC